VVTTSKVPRGCFRLREGNGDTLIFDPRAPLTRGSQVLVYLRGDLRVRLLATYEHEFVHDGTAIIRVRVDSGEGHRARFEFDRAMVDLAVVVKVDRVSGNRALM
jgi:hypothetical protein